VIGNTPEFENSTGNECFDRLLDARFFNIIWVRGGVRGRVIVLESWNVDVIPAMWMAAPAEVHTVSIRIVKLVVRSSRPLNINPGRFGITEAVIERDLQDCRIEIIIKRWRCERFFSLDHVTDREQSWPVD
jgi:hypothetical protein